MSEIGEYGYAEAGKDFWPQEIEWLMMLFGEDSVHHSVETVKPGWYRHTIIVDHCPSWEWDGKIVIREADT